MEPLKPIVIQFGSPAAAAAPSPPKSSPSVAWVAVAVLAVALAFVVFRSPSGGDPSPVPPTPVPPAVNAADVAEKATRAYAANLAAAMDKVAAMVDSKEIATSEQLKTNVRAYTEAARTQAFAPIDAIDSQVINQTTFDGVESVVSGHLRNKAAGHRKASK